MIALFLKRRFLKPVLGFALILFLAWFLLSTAFLATSAYALDASSVGDGWTQFHYDIANSGFNPSEVFTTPLTLTRQWFYPPKGTIHGTYASPSVATVELDGQPKDLVYEKLYDGIYVYDAENGQYVWSYPFSGSWYWWGMPPAVYDGKVYVGGFDGEFYCLNAATGALVWQKSIGGVAGSPIYGAPTVSNGVVYVGVTDGNLYALDALNGDTVWTFPTGGLGFSTPAVADVGGEEVVYIGATDNKVYAVNASTGLERWNYPTGNYIHCSPAVSEGVVYIGSYDNNLYALDADTGSFDWSYPTGDSIFSSPAVADGIVYFGSKDNTLYALNTADGSLNWNYSTTSAIYSSPAIAAHTDGSKTIFFSSGSNMYGVGWDSASSSAVLKWQYSDGYTVNSSPAIYGKRVFINSFDFFYAFAEAGMIEGCVYEDFNQNGVKDAGEPGIGGVTVNVRDSLNTVTVLSVVTGDSGCYEFLVPVGAAGSKDYKVVEGTPPLGEDPPGYKSTTSNVLDVTVTSGAISEASFGDIFDYDDLVIIRENPVNGNQRMLIYDAPTTIGGDLGTEVASDTWIGNTNQDSNVTHVTTGDFDGDGIKETALIRENKTTGDQRLMIYETPTTVGGDLGTAIATDDAAGNVGDNSKIIIIAAGDFDSDNRDEIAIVRERTDNGNQRLYIYESPTTIGGSLGLPIISDNWIGNANQNTNVVLLTAGDLDGDQQPELAMVRQSPANGNQRLTIYEAPTTVGGDIGSPIADDGWIGNDTTNMSVTQIAAGDFYADHTIDELALVRFNPANNNQRLAIYDTPTTVGGDIGAPKATDSWIGNATQDTNVAHMTSL